jgi:hypothetical protein
VLVYLTVAVADDARSISDLAVLADQEDYAKPQLFPVAELVRIIASKAGDTPREIIGNGFSGR